MSRSRRKPWVKDGYGTRAKRWSKTHHNRKVRRKLRNPDKEIPDGCAHKNGPGLNRWDVCDYKWYEKKPINDRTCFVAGEVMVVETLADRMKRWRKLCRK